MLRMTEYLDIELEARRWRCHQCGHDLGPAGSPYKEGCLVIDRDPREVHPVFSEEKEFNFSFDPEWVRLLEFVCPGCATLIETEYLPPGHPLTWDIEIDLDALEARYAAGELETEQSEAP
jgi:acetone carboxylase gamma subunit